MDSDIEPQDPHVILTFSFLLAALAAVFLIAIGQAELHLFFTS